MVLGVILIAILCFAIIIVKVSLRYCFIHCNLVHCKNCKAGIFSQEVFLGTSTLTVNKTIVSQINVSSKTVIEIFQC